MVASEMHFIAVFVSRKGNGHDSGIVEDDVDAGDGLVLQDGACRFANRFQRGHLSFDKLDFGQGIDGLYGTDCRKAFFGATTDEYNRGGGAMGQRDGTLSTKTAWRRAGD